ncbi:hypothetical protein EAI_07168 [Harpegnathos saltator]|uniref:Complementary sex determiner C-terminal domain-containing protein n=1 Tax=Harpegnathos saltator TaxID=610380 RepID=E2C628_HARSA|nr:hypothetical protein EAI_07168 [Harpegnathos saltator]
MTVLVQVLENGIQTIPILADIEIDRTNDLEKEEIETEIGIGIEIEIEKEIEIEADPEIGEIQHHIMLNTYQCLFIMNFPPRPYMVSPMVTIPRGQVPPLGRGRHPPLMGPVRPFPPRFVPPDIYRMGPPAPNPRYGPMFG